MPLVSAAITTYNRARYLPEAIESVLGQTFRDLELIVVDDGSTDDTEAVVTPYLDRLRYVRQDRTAAVRRRGTQPFALRRASSWPSATRTTAGFRIGSSANSQPCAGSPPWGWCTARWS